MINEINEQRSAARADLHVHSCYSLQSGNLKFLKSRDSYSAPEDIYKVAKARGMDFVTITDHDSIDGCLEFLDRNPYAQDFFVSAEVSCWFPDRQLQVHLGVYGLTERLHRQLQRLRHNVFDVMAALRESGVFFSVNHLFHFYRGQVPLAEYFRLLDEAPALETRNGTMLPVHNELVARIACSRADGRPSLGRTGGSDAHTLRRIGHTWTTAPGVTVKDFLDNLALRRSDVGGVHGNARCVAADAYGVIGAYVASLLGWGPRDHAFVHRAACLLFSAVSIPAQVLPVIMTTAGKIAEAREVRHISTAMPRLVAEADSGAGAIGAQA